jgi:hypothetical protein
MVVTGHGSEDSAANTTTTYAIFLMTPEVKESSADSETLLHESREEERESNEITNSSINGHWYQTQDKHQMGRS